MNDKIKIPNEKELAEVVYNYCKTNNITFIREDELIRKITDDETNNIIIDYNLNDKLLSGDKEKFDESIIKICDFSMFTYVLSKRFYDIIDILIEENKADRKKKENEKFYYLKFYLLPIEIETIKLIRSNREIYANELYDYCKKNNIEILRKNDIKHIINLKDEELINNIIDILVKKDLVRISWDKDNCFLIFLLAKNKIQLNKNQKLLIKNTAELILYYFTQNNITYIEKDSLQEGLELSDEIFNSLLDYLVERHLADIEYNSKDGKMYILMYY